MANSELQGVDPIKLTIKHQVCALAEVSKCKYSNYSMCKKVQSINLDQTCAYVAIGLKHNTGPKQQAVIIILQSSALCVSFTQEGSSL